MERSLGVCLQSRLSQRVHKDDPPELKREIVVETISKLGRAAIEIYTDVSVFRGCREGGAGALIIDNHNQEEHLVEAPAGSTTSLYRAEMVAISDALQKVVELQKRSFVPKEAHINLYTDSRSAIQKLAKATGKEEIVHHVLTLVEQIVVGGNAQMMFQWIPGHCGIEGNMWADSIVKVNSAFYPPWKMSSNSFIWVMEGGDLSTADWGCLAGCCVSLCLQAARGGHAAGGSS